MKTWGAIVIAVVLGACAGPVPECVGYTRIGGEMAAWPNAACGEFGGDDSPTVIGHGDGSTSMTMAVCSDAWSLGCDEAGFIEGDRGGRIPACAAIGAAPTCDSGEAPRCVVVPCDGTTYYGAAHPMAGE